MAPRSPNSLRDRTPTHGFGRGFTLVELLVVIGIIAVLMGILLPVMGKVRIAAKRTACAAQLHDIGMQFNMYLNENKGRLPRIDADGSVYGTPQDLVPGALPMALLLKPYNGGAFKVFRCPADSVLNSSITTDFSNVDENGNATAGVPNNGLTMLSKNADSWYEAVGSSYEYSSRFNASADMSLKEETDPIAQEVHKMETWSARLAEMVTFTRRDGTQVTHPASQIWVFRDCDPFHGKVLSTDAQGGHTYSVDSRNFLYADFHVGTTPYGDY